MPVGPEEERQEWAGVGWYKPSKRWKGRGPRLVARLAVERERQKQRLRQEQRQGRGWHWFAPPFQKNVQFHDILYTLFRDILYTSLLLEMGVLGV